MSTNNKTNKLYIMCGLPGSGKSTYAKTLNAANICPDNIREELCGNAVNQSKNKEVFSLAFERAQKLLEDGKDVVFDATNVTISARRNVLNKLSAYCGKTICVVVGTNKEKCKQRNMFRERHVPEFVIERMSNVFVYPSKKEGFDKILCG